MSETYILRKGYPISTAISGNGYSLNLIDVTSTGAGSNTRGLRVNVTTDASISHGDLQCVHGYLTLGSSASLASNAAVYPLSAWIDIPNTTTTGSGNIIAGCRVIFDPNNNDLGALAGGGESALFYGQTWASTGRIDSGIRIVAGSGSTITAAFGAGGAGTFTRLFDFTESAQEQVIAVFATADTSARKIELYVGDAATSAAVFAQASATAGLGSLYISSVGKLFIRNAGAGAAADWPEFNSTGTV